MRRGNFVRSKGGYWDPFCLFGPGSGRLKDLESQEGGEVLKPSGPETRKSTGRVPETGPIRRNGAYESHVSRTQFPWHNQTISIWLPRVKIQLVDHILAGPDPTLAPMGQHRSIVATVPFHGMTPNLDTRPASYGGMT